MSPHDAYSGEILLRSDLDLLSGAGFKLLPPFKRYGDRLYSSLDVMLASRTMQSCLLSRFRSECDGSSNEFDSFFIQLRSFSTFDF